MILPSRPPAPGAALLALALLVSGLARAAEPPSGVAAGKAALEAARAAYQRAGAFREAMELVIELPDGRREPKRHEYGVGKDGAFFSLSSGGKETIRIVARDGRMIGTQFNVPKRYAEVPYRGDFADALRRLGGVPAQIAAPPAIAARQGGSAAAFLEALRYGVLEPLEVAGFRPAAKGSQGKEKGVDEVELRAANGRATVGLDPVSHRLRTIVLALGEGEEEEAEREHEQRGEEEEGQVRAVGTFRFVAGEPGGALALPDLAGRTAVATLAEMQAKEYPLGQPAPQVALGTPGGETVRTADLKGSVVVLDFWATWCVPCWTALKHTAELAAWAKGSGLPVKVFAVDTLENTTDPVEQSRRAAELLRTQGLDLPVLLDVGSAAFAAFHHPGLPSLVILDREGKLARYHSGLLEEMTATVKAEVLELAK